MLSILGSPNSEQQNMQECVQIIKWTRTGTCRNKFVVNASEVKGTDKTYDGGYCYCWEVAPPRFNFKAPLLVASRYLRQRPLVYCTSSLLIPRPTCIPPSNASPVALLACSFPLDPYWLPAPHPQALTHLELAVQDRTANCQPVRTVVASPAYPVLLIRCSKHSLLIHCV